MSRRKQPAPARLSDDLAGEGTGTGKNSKSGKASEVTRRSPVKGRQSRDRRQASAGLNGHGVERTTRGRRQSARNKELHQKQDDASKTITTAVENGDSQDLPLLEEAAEINDGCANGLNGELDAVNGDSNTVNGDVNGVNDDDAVLEDKTIDGNSANGEPGLIDQTIGVNGVNGDDESLTDKTIDNVNGDNRDAGLEENTLGVTGDHADLQDDSEVGHGSEGRVTGESVVLEGEASDTASPELAHGTTTNGCADDSQDDPNSGSGSYVGSSSAHIPEVADSSLCDSQLSGGVGGGGTTAGADQAASSQQPLTGGEAESKGETLGKEDDNDDVDDDDDAGIVGDDAEAVSSLSSSCGALSDHQCAPIDFSGVPSGELATVSSAMEVRLEGYNGSCGIDSMQESEETGLGESATSDERYSSQEADTKSLDGCNGLLDGSNRLLSFPAMPSSPSPTNSSSDSTPSKNSMKRRRPFECPESLTCSLCNIDFKNAHELTLHVRSHNTASSHSCTICNKKLSSTSSLDRHMLIHSGERPFTCPLCNMSFTTNGNMHRHLRTHEKGGELPPPDYVVKHDYAKPRKRVPSRRVLENGDMDQEGASPSPKKKHAHGSEKKPFGENKFHGVKKSHGGDIFGFAAVGEGIMEEAMDLSAGVGRVKVESSMEGGEGTNEEELSCPICGKTFLCRYGLQTHIEQHPNKVLECMICNATFRNQKGLRMHVHMAHRRNKSPTPKQGNCILPMEKGVSSMTELGFTEFSSPKFPLIAQVWCEKNSSRLTKTDNTLICDECDYAFPCLSALHLHKKKSHSVTEETDFDNCSGVVSLVTTESTVARDVFLAALNLKPVTPPQSPQKSPPQKKASSVVEATEDVPGGSILNSILSKPSLTSPEKAKTSLLQQHLEASPLLAMNHFSNPLGGKPHVVHTKSMPMKHSPVKGTTAGSDSALVKPECSATDLQVSSKESGLEPKSGDVAMEMHTPNEFACQSKTAMNATTKDDSKETAVADGDVSGALEDIEEEPCDLSSSSNKKRGEHVCKYCKKIFPFTSTLKVHLRSHMGLMPYKCMLCDYASADKSTLVRHMRTHSGERPYSCKVCDFAFTTKANCERHVRKRHNKNSKEEAEEVILHNPSPKHDDENKYSSPCTVCKICDRDFKFFRDLQNHLRVHEKTPQKPFTCTKCQVGFSSLSNCARHIVRRHEEVKADDVESCITVFQHSDEKNAPIIRVPTYIKEEPRSETPVFNQEGVQVEPLDFSVKPTTKNEKSSKTKRRQKTSIFTEDSPLDLSLPKSSLGEKFTVRNSSAIGKYRFKEAYHKFYSQTIDALVCPHCTTTFSRGSLLKAHIRSHKAERPFRCNQCAAAFTMQATLEAHVLRRHTDPYQLHGQQSYIARSATPMQFKLMSKSASALRYASRPSKTATATAIPLISPNTPVGAAEQVKVEQIKFEQGKVGPSPHNSMGSDSSGELASVSKMLAAADSNHFKLFLSPPESRSPIPQATNIFQQDVNDMMGEDNQKIHTDVLNNPLEMRDDDDSDMYGFERKEHENMHDSTDVSASMMDGDQYDPEGVDPYDPAGVDPYEPDDEHEGELQIVEDGKFDEQMQGDMAQDGEDKKETRGTKLESKQCCPYCGRRFPWISSLRRHILTHTGLKPYQCPQCGANFSTKSNCERHIVRRHGGARPGSLGGSVPGGQDQPFMCPECKGFKCTTRTQLQLHYEQDHPQIKFIDIYPEAKKVASASVAIANQQLEAKLAEERPLCLTKKPSEGSSTDGALATDDIPTDLSTSTSKQPKISKPLKVKLFMRNGDVTTSCMAGTPILSKVAESAVPVLESYGPAIKNEDGSSDLVMATNLVRGEQADAKFQVKVEADDEEDLGNSLMESDGERDARTGSSSAVSLTVPSYTVGPMLPSASKPQSSRKKDRARFECTQCCKRFKTAATLEKHEKIHEVEHPFHCTDCKATFTTKFNCHRHMMKLHNKLKEDVVKEEGAGSITNGLVNGDMKSDPELENMSSSSINIGDSVSALGESRVTSRNPTPVVQEKSRKRPAGIQAVKKTKSPKLDEALMSGAVLDLQTNSDKLMAVENWLNSDIKLQNGYGREEEMSEYDSDIPILNPESPTGTFQEDNSRSSGAWSGRKKPSGPRQQQQQQKQQGLYMASFLEDEDSLVAQDVANPSDVFSGGQVEEKNDIISNLLGIKDASVLDQIMESADSAARLLGVTDG